MGNLLRKQKASWSVFNRDSLISIQGREILLLVVKTGAVLGVLNYFFYREWWAYVLLIPVGVLYFRLECGNLIRKKQDQVREQFCGAFTVYGHIPARRIFRGECISG